MRCIWKVFNDLTRAAGRFDVAGDRRSGLEEAVALDAKPGKALEFCEFLQAHRPKFREAQIRESPLC